MPTNEERREVAARLRDIGVNTLQISWHELYAIKNACGCYTGQDKHDVELKDRLADLIEPDERTCRMEYNKSKRGVYCSHCGERMDVYTWENHVDGTAGYLYPFCYWCGAKVVQE